MADYLFNKTTTTKGEFLATVVRLLTDAGWTNVSSSPATDFYVLNSKGVNNDKNLFIQLRDYGTQGVGYNVTTSNYPVFSYRLIDNYTPGATGLAGTTTRASLAYSDAYIGQLGYDNATITKSDTLELYYYVDANGISMIIRPPAVRSIGSVFFLVRDNVGAIAKSSDSRGLAVTAYGHSYIMIDDTPDNMARNNTPYIQSVYSAMSPKNPNADGIYTMSEIVYGSPSEGYRSRLDGVYALPAQNIIEGDTFKVGNDTYTAFNVGSCGLPTAWIAVLTEKGV